MDEAIAYCTAKLSRRGNPPDVELNDLVQEYVLTGLEGGQKEDIQRWVSRTIMGHIRLARRQKPNEKMQLRPDDTHQEPAQNDEEYGNYIDTEREIEEGQCAELWAQLEKIVHRLNDYDPNELLAIRWHFGLSGEVRSLEWIASKLGKTEAQAEFLVRRGLERLRAIAVGKEIDLALFPGLKDVVHDIPEAYRKRAGGRFVRKEEPRLLVGV